MSVSPRRLLLALVLVSWCTLPARAQRPPEQLDAGEILHRMQGLGVLGSVLYLAAHPDDENTRLIGYLSNGLQVRTAYLSMTRGDGGQNLIGPELGDGLGVLRTQELLGARHIDGGEQFFTRAVDFGYSKSREETLALWGWNEILADAVRVVRTFRPDVIVTRFATDGSGGHGHHTASALVAHMAFDMAADPSAFPEQLEEGLEPWRVKRLFFNASTWWNPNLPDEAAKEPARWATLDVGGFDPLLGTSYTEIAGRSRSQHKSQGFGAAETRGEQLEYLRLEKGEAMANGDALDGVELGWARVPGGAPIGAMVAELVERFEPRAPEESLARLADLVRALDALARDTDDGQARAWARHHAATARELLLQVCGIVVEAEAERPAVARGESLEVTLTALQRRAGPAIELVGFADPSGATIPVGRTLPFNQPLAARAALTVPEEAPIDQPYWLAAPHGARFEVADPSYHGVEPASRASSSFRATLRLPEELGGLEFEVTRPLMRTWVDRVAGQRERTVVVTPVASVEPADTVAIVRGERAEVTVEVEALCEELSGVLVCEPPPGWDVEREPEPVAGLQRGERARLVVGLRRTAQAQAGELRLSFEGPEGTSARTMHVVDYPHVLPQTWYTPAEVRLVPLDVAVSVHTVGYVDGAGDQAPQALAQLGITVEHVDAATAQAADLAKLDAVVTGIRAYNTVPSMARLQPLLLDFVAGGGTLVVQYNTASRDMVIDPRAIGPRPFVLTRGRVTLETAAPTFLAPEHPLLTTPNRLGPADFEGWVQERGLYFAGDLDPAYTALISWHDPREEPLDGALITCEHGEGRFVYTGISLFRQLPAGVPGAYRLLANLVARRSAGE